MTPGSGDEGCARLFVYGTLKRGQRASGLLRSVGAIFVGPARVRGLLVDLGSYPGLVPPPDSGSWVRGELYELSDPGAALAALDAYEGCGPADPLPHEFERKTCSVVCEDGERWNAWTYFCSGGSAEHARVIPSGAWRI